MPERAVQQKHGSSSSSSSFISPPHQRKMKPLFSSTKAPSAADHGTISTVLALVAAASVLFEVADAFQPGNAGFGGGGGHGGGGGGGWGGGGGGGGGGWGGGGGHHHVHVPVVHHHYSDYSTPGYYGGGHRVYNYHGGGGYRYYGGGGGRDECDWTVWAVIGGCVLLLVLVVACGMCCKKSRSSRNSYDEDDEEMAYGSADAFADFLKVQEPGADHLFRDADEVVRCLAGSKWVGSYVERGPQGTIPCASYQLWVSECGQNLSDNTSVSTPGSLCATFKGDAYDGDLMTRALVEGHCCWLSGASSRSGAVEIRFRDHYPDRAWITDFHARVVRGNNSGTLWLRGTFTTTNGSQGKFCLRQSYVPTAPVVVGGGGGGTPVSAAPVPIVQGVPIQGGQTTQTTVTTTEVEQTPMLPNGDMATTPGMAPFGGGMVVNNYGGAGAVGVGAGGGGGYGPLV